MYLEIGVEKGSVSNGCESPHEWIRFVHVVIADTKKELIEKKTIIKKEVHDMSDTYMSCFLENWVTLEEYNKNK